jgi:foldase protein PrsA
VTVACALAIVAARLVTASPPQGQQKKIMQGKSTADQTKKSEADSSRAKTGSDPAIVAKVNGEDITYKALAEEVIARKGEEVLDTMISRLLVEQACRTQGIKITAQEINEEIKRTAERLQMTPEKYFAWLKEERSIGADQYQRDIVWPGLALKKLARRGVSVSQEEINNGFEAYYGEKVRCRWIMFNDQRIGTRVWNELKEAKGTIEGRVDVHEFESQVTRWSVDPGSRALGGQLQPISRHTSPAFQKIEDAAFALKEDGAISSLIQFGEAWVILYREARLPASNVKLEDVRGKIEADIYEAKMRDQIQQVFLDIKNRARIENLLTGTVSTPQDNNTVPAQHIEKKEPAKPGGRVDQSQKTGAPVRK